MGELSIKIKIADREYPMTVHPSEEERLRSAGKIINERIKHYRNQFGIDDKQDLLAMVAFDCLVEKLRLDSETNNTSGEILNRISALDSFLNDALSSDPEKEG